MVKLWSRFLGAVAVLLMGGRVMGDEFTLDITGPGEMQGFAGEVVPASFLCTLQHDEGTGPGAEAWSFGVLVENAVAVSITTYNTAADRVVNGGYWDGGLNQTEIVDPARNGGKQGAVSRIILSFDSGATLPRRTRQSIAVLDIEATMPLGEGTARLSYTDGLVGSGMPVSTTVTQDGHTFTPLKDWRTVPLRGVMGDVFTLDFMGDLEMQGRAGEVVPASFLCTLDHEEGTGRGAEAWSFGVLVENAVAVSITTDHTAADHVLNGGYWEGGLNQTQIVDPARNGGKQGAVSAIILSFDSGATLPRLTRQSIAVLYIEATMPLGEGTARLSYTDGLVGSGMPVSTIVTQDGHTLTPLKRERILPLRGHDTCCGKRVNVGFSGEIIRKDTNEDMFGGILGGDDARCLARDGTLVTKVAAGEVGFTHLYANVISNLPEEPMTSRVQAWSLSIHVDGDVDIKTVTTAGTAADTVANGGFFDSGYNRTEIVDPDWNEGLRGCVSVVVLSFTQDADATLPHLGTQSVLDMGIEAASAQDFAEITGKVQFLSGLIVAGGEHVMNAITVGGNSESACNLLFDWAGATVEFSVYPRRRSFRRGLLNGDGKLNIADPIFLINALFRSGSPLRCVAAADVNDDGMTDSSDAVYLMNHLFVHGPPPVGPFDECGPAPESRCAEDTAECPQ